MLINKEYENPRYGDASIPFKHPTYLPNHRKNLNLSLNFIANK